MDTTGDLLAAVNRLLSESAFQDVRFRCDDGQVVSANRAFLAARCEYFERLLFGSLREASAEEIRLHASSEAFRHVLVHLHTGNFGSLAGESCWITLMEASSLAQQYILPGMVQHVADRLSADLSPANLGLALSHALKNDLQAVIKSIWITLPRLLQRPFALDRSFSADAICFCLQHTAWMAPPSAKAAAAAAGGAGGSAASNLATAASSGAAGGVGALAGEASGTGLSRGDLGLMHRASSINGASVGSSGVSGHPQGAEGLGAGPLSRALYAPGSRSDSSMVQEAAAFSAVLDWMLQEVAGCADCQATRTVAAPEFFCSSSSSLSTTPRAAAAACAAVVDVHPAGFGHLVPSFGAAACGQPLGSSSKAADASAPAAVSAAAAAAGSSRAGRGACDLSRSCSATTPPSPPLLAESSQPQHPAMQTSRQHSLAAQALPAAESAGMVGQAGGRVGRLSSHSVRSSYESDTTEGEADIRSLRSFGTTGGGAQPAQQEAAAAPVPVPVPASAFAATTSSSSRAAAAAANPAADASGAAGVAGGAAVAAAADDKTDPPAAAAAPQAAAAGAADQQQDAAAAALVPDLVYSGCCCVGHQGMLLQMLAHLNWHLLEPRELDKLDSLALLGPSALLEIYRAHQRCCHLAQWGNFPCLSLGGERGLRCYVTGGEQVLECESVSHLTATSNLCFTSGKHCWQFVVTVPCDLVWLGLSDGSLTPDVWGGKQPGGWFYGSNDALCHNKQSDRHAYTKHCGNGKWGECAVVDVCLDMDAREVWFGVDGAEPKLGFSGLPDRVYPAVSLRAPAQLLVRFRAASWIMSEAQQQQASA